ncbi:hypothetical protein HYW18_03055 [Candidatus Uhrbacteria bacterium]|nr:hypothetical protein [Candidatus Uhrbacteria bacterium]
MLSLSNLLTPALRRAGIERAVLAAQVVSATEEWLTVMLPEATRNSAKAISVYDETIHIACTNRAVGQFLEGRYKLLEAHVVRAVPKMSVRALRTRIVAFLP